MSVTIDAARSIPPVPRTAWRVLSLGVVAQAAGAFFTTMPAFLIPFLHTELGMSLAEAGLFASAPTVGMVLTLVAWGALADRIGERWVMSAGLALTAVAAFLVPLFDEPIGMGALLLVAGAAGASTNVASGRIVVAWFPRERRGLAMGIRQMAPQLGIGLSAIVVPSLAVSAGIGAPFLLGGVILAVLAVACAIGLREPPRAAPIPAAVSAPAAAPAPGVGTRGADARPVRPANPYRAGTFLPRIHAVSILLVIPQFTLATFGLVWLIAGMGWDPIAAGVVVAVAQVVSGLARPFLGTLSDRLGSRVRVIRVVAVAAIALMLLLAASGWFGWSVVGGVLLVLGVTVTSADNGLAFTSVAEAAGGRWAGRALGIQNTGQFLAGSAVGPAVGALITLVGYPVAFALIALAPLAALPLMPRQDADRA